MHVKRLLAESFTLWNRQELINYLFVAGLTYLMIATPVNMVSHTTAISVLLLLLSITHHSFFTFVRSHLKILAAIIALLVASAVFSPLPAKASTGAFNVFKGLWILPVALLAADTFTPHRFERVALFFGMISSVVALSLLVWVVDWSAPYQSINAWSSTHVGNIHNLDNFLFISLLLAGIVTWQHRRTSSRLTGLCSLLPLLLISVLVQSEGSLLALACTCLLLAGLSCQKKALRYGLLTLALLPVLLLQVFYVFPEQFSSLTGLQVRTLQIRSQIYAQLLETCQQQLFTGWGAATYKYVEMAAVDGYQFLYPHNLYLEALFSFGIIGSVLLTAWIINALLKINFSAAVKNPATAFALATLTYLSIKGMSDMNLMSYHTVGLFSVCFGLSLGSRSCVKLPLDKENRNRMHIINTVFGSARGGRWQVLIDYSRWLREAGHEVTVIIGTKTDEPTTELKAIGCKVIRMSNFGFYDPVATVKLWHLLRQIKPDAVISHGGRSTCLFKRAKPLHTPLIAVNHSNNVKRSIGADIFFNISNHIEKLIRERTLKGRHFRVFNCPRKHCIHPPQAMEMPVQLSFMGRLTATKGVDVLLNALVQLKQQGIDFTCSIAGSGDLEEFQKLRDRLGLAKQVEFVGQVQDPVEFLAKSHIFCFPTLGEGFPISPIEAFAAGCAVIGTDDPGTAELLEHGELGMIVPRRDARAFADALTVLIKNPEQRLAMAYRAQQRYRERYTPAQAKACFLQALEEGIHQLKR
ncbi:glycosyltransferase [Marinobacter gelidimuriae]|uniref:glycosyltransferase n=1 Tax=Marinobacter gelidimuriae TaxID=2739064 RepID=UPI00036AE472|nr:glycosyltransferase [Marinobacter gelidimuriae]